MITFNLFKLTQTYIALIKGFFLYIYKCRNNFFEQC